MNDQLITEALKKIVAFLDDLPSLLQKEPVAGYGSRMEEVKLAVAAIEGVTTDDSSPAEPADF